MSMKLLTDVLTDDSGLDYDPIRVILIFMGLGLIIFSGYDIYKAWQSYDLLLAAWSKMATAAAPNVSLPPLPPSPKFDTQSFGIAGGALIGSYGAKKWLTKTTDNGGSEVKEQQ